MLLWIHYKDMESLPDLPLMQYICYNIIKINMIFNLKTIQVPFLQMNAVFLFLYLMDYRKKSKNM